MVRGVKREGTSVEMMEHGGGLRSACLVEKGDFQKMRYEKPSVYIQVA
jgi:hypothetical protein